MLSKGPSSTDHKWYGPRFAYSVALDRDILKGISLSTKVLTPSENSVSKFSTELEQYRTVWLKKS